MKTSIERVLALALRHKPELFSIIVDNDGWADLSALVRGLNAQTTPDLSLTEHLLRTFVASDQTERFEIRNNRIRALYGHSLPQVAIGELKTPPVVLYHATRAALLPRILREGLTARGRNGVHLTERWSYAIAVRESHSQKGQKGVVLAVQTEGTHLKGIPFFQATEHIWLSPYIPARYLSMVALDQDASPPVPPNVLIPLEAEYNRSILLGRLSELGGDGTP